MLKHLYKKKEYQGTNVGMMSNISYCHNLCHELWMWHGKCSKYDSHSSLYKLQYPQVKKSHQKQRLRELEAEESMQQRERAEHSSWMESRAAVNRENIIKKEIKVTVHNCLFNMALLSLSPFQDKRNGKEGGGISLRM